MAEVLGLGDLRQQFERVAADMQAKLAARMVASAGGVLRKRATEIALASGLRITGAMVRNIAIKRERDVPNGVVQYNLGVRHGRDLTKKQRNAPGNKRLGVNGKGRIVTRYADDPYYWGWVERGHKIVPRKGTAAAAGKTSISKRRKAATGRVPAHAFIGPALDQGRADAIDAMSKPLERYLAKTTAGS